MKITLLLGSVLLGVTVFPSFGSECQVFDGRSASGCTDSKSVQCEQAAVAAALPKGGANIQLGFDGNDNVLSPDAKRPFEGKDRPHRSSVFAVATALILASRALKSR